MPFLTKFFSNADDNKLRSERELKDLQFVAKRSNSDSDFNVYDFIELQKPGSYYHRKSENT